MPTNLLSLVRSPVEYYTHLLLASVTVEEGRQRCYGLLFSAAAAVLLLRTLLLTQHVRYARVINAF